MQPKIITITANTAIDRVLIKQVLGRRAKTVRQIDFPAGKGINVARTVAILGEKVIALGFVGRPEKRLFDTLRSHLLKIDLLPIAGQTRVNITTYDTRSRSTSHERNKGYRLTEYSSSRLLSEATRSINRRDIVVISGSMPTGGPSATYPDLIKLCRKRGAISVLDTSGHELRRAVKEHPVMVKPNIEELEVFLGHKIGRSPGTILKHARAIAEEGIALVAVSCGARGLVIYSRRDSKGWMANVRINRPPAPTGSIGSGDSLVAGFAVGLLHERPIVEVIRLGVACAAANVLSLGPGVCRRVDIRKLLPRVQIREMSQFS